MRHGHHGDLKGISHVVRCHQLTCARQEDNIYNEVKIHDAKETRENEWCGILKTKSTKSGIGTQLAQATSVGSTVGLNVGVTHVIITITKDQDLIA